MHGITDKYTVEALKVIWGLGRAKLSRLTSDSPCPSKLHPLHPKWIKPFRL